jgi:CheY-like chemotaxis protein
VALPEEPLILQADRVRLTQVFANLLNNAAKYTDPGGRIWVEVVARGRAWRWSRCATPASASRPESLPRVFDMFAQAHRAVGRGQGGLGIGLTMVRSLVEMHGGTVEARSGGSEPWAANSWCGCRWPGSATPARAAGLAQRGRYAFAGQRILVVDDNRDAADTLGLLLEADGAEDRVVYDGRSALAMAESFLPCQRAARHRHAGHGRLRGGAPPALLRKLALRQAG